MTEYPQQSIGELAEIKETKEEAIARSFENSQDPWKEYALHCLEVVAKKKQEFTVNDVRPLIEAGPYKTQDNRAIGGVFRQAQKRGWIDTTGAVRVNKTGHGIQMQVWRSRIYGETIQFTIPTEKEKKYRIKHIYDKDRNCMVEIKEEIIE